MLGYLQGSTRPVILMAVHQCARFNAYPMLCHEKGLRDISSVQKTKVYIASLILREDLKCMSMRTSQEVGHRAMYTILNAYFPELVMLFCTQDVLSLGPANSKLR